ncbi:MAG TPA: HAMP domain-containing sensor histidine kinase [Streptosporangiaceae bacterium]|jgi:signal transduction histidine kinase|nr:HAMP domain-containing sensor histidine kinase [Streptosporangiaceae bacterium]
MTRRIVLAVLALVAAVLGIVAVPLGVITTSQDMRAFRNEAVVAAATVVNVAEERLDDGVHGSSLGRTVRQLARGGDRIVVLDRAGRAVVGTAARPAVTKSQLATAVASGKPASYQSDDRLLIVSPVHHDTGAGIVGVVVLGRPTSAVDHQAALLWGMIAAIATAGLLAAALVAIGLARWVSKPLSRLKVAAQELGDGRLSTRALANTGPSEVRQLAANFNSMAARLEALVSGHQATIADVSHQLRTPLAALRLRLDLLAQDSNAAAAAELAGAQEEIARLSRMVNGLLAVARAENIATPQVNLQLDVVIKTRVAAWLPAADERGVRLEADAEQTWARIGEGHLEQILDNLIANALDVLRAGGVIRITGGVVGDRARIIVADNGPGMSEQQQKVAFRRFATSNGGGTGLGLAIVDRLTVASGGTAALSDTSGGGLTVTIELPLARRERGQRRGIHLTSAAIAPSDTGPQQRWQRRTGRLAEPAARPTDHD